ncbi:cobyrinate a,c-diamide synthase [Butyrivibrio sp. WCE2006]|uniref:cobyrinate a,c-diamide synthase n=1 Tax=Butyrivibrio sp. WCE2006 TaxID=1410611 RepID=UPI000679AF52|nr:cobyrinate a,c-diamide synthase [Butyrivibrio sp. WCE2006]
MSREKTKGIMLAAPLSGSGKTTITCALLKALKKKGLKTVSFKCGPDYIDPLFHKKALGIEGRNLDTFFAGAKKVAASFSKCEADIAVVEGVMGLYDGMNAGGLEGSSYEIAKALNLPIVLIVDASGVGRTIISLVKGMLIDDTNKLIKGVILNKISENFYNNLKPVFEKEISSMRSDVKLLGFFPKNKDIVIESRHLGLKLPEEMEDIKKKISAAAENLQKNVDLNELIKLAEEHNNDSNREIEKEYKQSDGFTGDDTRYDSKIGEGLTLAIAYDDAFCFYYKDNFELFEEYGVKLKMFSPLKDKELPADADGILLGGGYPENHLEELSHNESMRRSIKAALDRGIPSLAECGGFMYLHKTITDIDGNSYEMVSEIDGECHYTGHLVRFGYMEIESESHDSGSDSDINNIAFSKKEEGSDFDEDILRCSHVGMKEHEFDEDILRRSLVGMKGHEFHYYDSSNNGDALVARKPGKDIRWNCMISQNNGIWGFPHFYYNSNPEFIKIFIGRMRAVKDEKLK